MHMGESSIYIFFAGYILFCLQDVKQCKSDCHGFSLCNCFPLFFWKQRKTRGHCGGVNSIYYFLIYCMEIKVKNEEE